MVSAGVTICHVGIQGYLMALQPRDVHVFPTICDMQSPAGIA